MASQRQEASPLAPISGSSWQPKGYLGLGDLSRKPNVWCWYETMSRRPSRLSVKGPSPLDQNSHSCQASTVHMSRRVLEAATLVRSVRASINLIRQEARVPDGWKQSEAMQELSGPRAARVPEVYRVGRRSCRNKFAAGVKSHAIARRGRRRRGAARLLRVPRAPRHRRHPPRRVTHQQ